MSQISTRSLLSHYFFHTNKQTGRQARPHVHISICYFNTATLEQSALQSDVSGAGAAAATVTPYPALSILSLHFPIDRHYYRVPLVSLARFLTSSSFPWRVLTAYMTCDSECSVLFSLPWKNRLVLSWHTHVCFLTYFLLLKHLYYWLLRGRQV